MELNYQKKFQEMQQSTRRNQIEEIQKSFKLSAGNPRKEAQETKTHPELLICWRCCEVGQKKKECTAILFCTNCSPGLSDEEVKEEMMMFFTDTNEKASNRNDEVAHARAHRLSPDDQLSSSEIIAFTTTLQPFIQDKLLKRIDGDRPSRSL